MVKIDVSIGELVDKVTILSIKLEKIQNEEKLKHIRKEYALLRGAMEEVGMTEDDSDFNRLRSVNLKLWDIEDRIRLKEANQAFDDDFVQLARSVYLENDRRAAVKREINLKYGSELVEEKEYVDYRNKETSES